MYSFTVEMEPFLHKAATFTFFSHNRNKMFFPIFKEEPYHSMIFW